MLSFVTSQAVALSQAKQRPNKPGTSSQQGAAPRTGKGLLKRLVEVLSEAQKRKAEREIERHSRLYKDQAE
jgi:hypothetical protein